MNLRRGLTARAKRSGVVQRIGGALDVVVPAPDRLCTVLTFHRLDTGEHGLYPGLAGLDPDSFERFVDELVERFRPIGVQELLGALAGECRLPARSVLVTFDDAYRDFAEFAWPILRARDVPVVLFVPTAYPDDPSRRFWWDELYAALAATAPADWRTVGIEASGPEAAFRSVRGEIKSMPHESAVRTVHEMVATLEVRSSLPAPSPVGRVLGWDDLAELASSGVTLAPHSRTHPMLDQLRVGQLDDEVRGSLDELRDRIGPDRVPPVFAYPAGGHDPQVREAVRRAGYVAAFTTERGLVDVVGADPHRLPRVNVGRASSVGVVAAEAAMHRVRHLRRRARRNTGG